MAFWQTFCSRLLSKDWILICSLRRLACRAAVSDLALFRTWAISSFALELKKYRCLHSLQTAQQNCSWNHTSLLYLNVKKKIVSQNLALMSHNLQQLASWHSTYWCSFSSACAFSAWYLCSSFLILARYSSAHFFKASSFWPETSLVSFYVLGGGKVCLHFTNQLFNYTKMPAFAQSIKYNYQVP